MGFTVPRTTFKLKFKDPEYDGLEVIATELSTGELWQWMEDEKVANAGGDTGMEARRRLLQVLAEAIVSWNAEDDKGQPVPTTVEGLLAQGHRFNNRLMDAWTDALVGISAPLPQPSADGAPSAEASIPMESLSPSLTS
jgi:hypothetical protein